MGGGGGQQPQYIQNDYGDSLAEALDAQLERAPQLFAAEADREFGRPAYARLNQNLVEEGLLGEEIFVDNQGYTSDFQTGVVPEGGYEITDPYEYLIDKHNLHALVQGYDGPNDRAEWTRGMGREQIVDTWLTLEARAGRKREKPQAGVYDSAGKKVDGTEVKKFVGGEQGVRREGGAVSLIAGNQKNTFSDGFNRKAGFDSAGNFLGTSALEQDMFELAKDQQTRSEIGMANKYGQGLTDAYRKQGGITDALSDFNSLGDQTSDHGGLRSSMIGMAKDELAAGGSLTDRERRRVEQTSRAAMGARGRSRDFAGVVDEVASNETLSRQRETERRLFASQVLGLADQGLAQDRAFAAQRVGIEQATSADPFMAITGRSSGASVASGQNLYGNAAAGISAGPTLYNPQQGAAFIANQTAGLNNFNANMYSANQQASAGMFGGVMGAAGSLGSAAILACWVAREVYGVHSPKWMTFREWLLNLSPVWFRAIYLTFGERFAAFIRNKPRLKARIRAWMDTKIREA